MFDARKEFKSLLNIYISQVLIPKKEYLQSDKFDRSNYLMRLNKGSFLTIEASSIGSILKSEYSNLLQICSSSQMISKNSFLCFKFSDVVCDLLVTVKCYSCFASGLLPFAFMLVVYCTHLHHYSWLWMSLTMNSQV